jgi:hypothetical protein
MRRLEALGLVCGWIAVTGAGCGGDVQVAGRSCTDAVPCPAPFVCAANATCQSPCEGNADCPSDKMCMSGLCLDMTFEQACSSQQDCADTDVCRAGLCEPAANAECQNAAECQNPGVCQAAAGATCETGRCRYPAQQCDAVPGAECSGADDVFRSYAAGTCAAVSGACEYPVTETACAGCAATCLEPCRDLSCPDLSGGCQTGGHCVPQALPQPAECEYETAADGIACTDESGGAGNCSAGRCLACTQDTHCDDNNPCTQDTCDVGAGTCSHPAQAGSCDDGNLCTTGDACAAGLCRGSAVSCNAQPGECYEAAGACNGASGVCEYPAKTGGVACTADQQACTRDVCDGNGACIHPPQTSGAGCDDGNICSHSDRCNGNGACQGTAIVCDDGFGVCGAARSCDGSPQCAEVFPTSSTSCDDNNLCTHTDACNGFGSCQGTGYSCNDTDICTSDVCDGGGSCSNTAGPPSGLAPTGGAIISRQDVILVWGSCATATEYELEIQYQRADLSWRPYVIYPETGTNKTFYPCSSQSPAAPCNSDFRFRVRAFSGGAWGPNSGWATFHWANCRAC